MSWTEYYDLLDKYEGDLNKASKNEMLSAMRGNPNTPQDALALAWKKFYETHTFRGGRWVESIEIKPQEK